MIKLKRIVLFFAMSALLSQMAGCGSPSTQASSQGQTGSPAQSSSSAVISEPPQSSSALSSEDMVSSSPAVSSETPASSAPVVSAPPQTQKAVPGQVKAALNTKVPVLLPKSVPVAKGSSLAATTTSQTWDYTVSFFETAQPAAVNSQAASKGTPIATLEGTEYKDAASAQDSISAYLKIDVSGLEQDMVKDLGHNIKARADAGLGSQWLTWNEGRWCLWVDSPTDPAFQNKEYPDGGQLAKDVVSYLEENTLPAPHEIGVVYIVDTNGAKTDSGSRIGNTSLIRWQQNQMVYQITSENPMTAIKIAVAMNQ